MELDNDNQRGQMAKAFVFALYEDMADFFKEYAGSSKFMIGGDEVGLSSSTWAYSDFVTYVNELNSKLKAKGYTVRMYNDFIGSTIYNSTIQYGFGKAVYGADSANGFDRDIEIVYWNSDFNPSTGSSNASTGNYTWHVKFFWENNTGTTDNWGDGGRTMYNAAQTYTYYVLRAANSTSSTRDARNPNNRNWTFYRSTEEHIYNEWYPADISERGDYSENAADVPADQLGGAYFLIWNDYAAVSTEKQVWEGAPDVANSSTKYYLLDRMASNIIKMWNADVNSSVSYTEFAAVRDAVNEDFPGFTSCSADAYLPEASEITEATETVDKSALIAALNNVIQVQGNFTDDSWSKYQAAIDAAEIVRDDEDATQDEVDAALDALIAAEKALVSVDKSALKAAIDAALTDQGVYTDESWSAYQAALSAAKAVYEDGNATQAQVDKALNDLKAAKDALKEKDPGSSTDPTDPPTEGVTGSILKVEKVTKTARLGKQVGLRITTSADVQNITVEGEKLTICTCSKAQNLNGFEGQVKVWLIGFPADQTGEFTYNIAADNGGSAVVNITVK